MKPAIEIAELNALIEKYRRGDWVLWADLVADAQKHLFGFRGVGRINNAAEVAAIGKSNITPVTRYPHTKGELAALFGVTRKTLDGWERSGLVTLKKTRQKTGYSWFYDAKDLLRQIEKHAKGNKKE